MRRRIQEAMRELRLDWAARAQAAGRLDEAERDLHRVLRRFRADGEAVVRLHLLEGEREWDRLMDLLRADRASEYEDGLRAALNRWPGEPNLHLLAAGHAVPRDPARAAWHAGRVADLARADPYLLLRAGTLARAAGDDRLAANLVERVDALLATGRTATRFPFATDSVPLDAQIRSGLALDAQLDELRAQLGTG
jgi:hypothetical protein